MSRDLVTVRAIRPHDTTEGLKQPGDEYQRPAAEVRQLAGIVETVTPKAKPKAKPRRK